jgi:hypothetical protein
LDFERSKKVAGGSREGLSGVRDRREAIEEVQRQDRKN